MDWIERLLHISPDGGNGTVEFVVYVTLGHHRVAHGAGWRLRRGRRKD
jgi:hypothetical protein